MFVYALSCLVNAFRCLEISPVRGLFFVIGRSWRALPDKACVLRLLYRCTPVGRCFFFPCSTRDAGWDVGRIRRFTGLALRFACLRPAYKLV